MVVRVKQLFRLLRARLAEVVLVERGHFGVEVRHAESRLLVVGVETGRAGGADFVGREARLTAAADATAAARHHFDEVVARLDAVLDVFAHSVQNLLDVAHLVGDRDVDGRSLDVDRRGFDAVHAADRAELDRRRLSLLGDETVGRAESRFHNAAGDAEDRARAGVGAEKIVGRFIRERHEVDTGGLDHAREFVRRDDLPHPSPRHQRTDITKAHIPASAPRFHLICKYLKIIPPKMKFSRGLV